MWKRLWARMTGGRVVRLTDFDMEVTRTIARPISSGLLKARRYFGVPAILGKNGKVVSPCYVRHWEYEHESEREKVKMKFPSKTYHDQTYTKEQCKELAECFRSAKQHLWDGSSDGAGHTYICHAIQATRDECRRVAMSEVESRLESRPGFVITALDWAVMYGGLPEEKRRAADIQAYRHAWLDTLVEEFEGEVNVT